jgi:hypothetical protein
LANTVTLKVKIDDNGDLQLLSSKAEKAAKSTEKLSKSTDKASKSAAGQTKQNKGVAGATSNSTKAFSKMTTGITGGLVPAYAVLAANVFALTAAFGALQRAFSAELLEQGLIRVGNAAGQNLPYVAEGLKEISGAAVSLEARMRSTALAFSAGFSTEQLEALTRVAKGASVALGRDMGDAMDRLVRGTAKLEPEILDELGIMVRLDDAVRTYAAELKVADTSLTQFQRRQAFLNASIEQGAKKFGDVARSIDTNPYDKLAATFADLTKSGLMLVNNVMTPLISFLASSPSALAGVLLAFGSTLIRTILPAIGEMSIGHKKAAQQAGLSAQKASRVITAEYTKATAAVASGLSLLPKSIQHLAPKIKAGTLTLKEQAQVTKILGASEKLRAAALNKGLDSTRLKREAELAQIRQQIVLVKKLKDEESRKTTSSQKGVRAKGRSRISGITSAGLNDMEKAEGIMGKFKVATRAASLQMKTLGKTSGSVFTKVRVGAAAARGAVVLFGTAFLNAIPIIGQVLFVLSLLWPLVSGLFGKGKLEKELDAIQKSLQSITGIGAQLSDTLKTITDESDRYYATLKATVGIMNQISGAYAKYEEKLKSDRMDKLIEKQRELGKAEQTLSEKTEQFAGKSQRFRDRNLKGYVTDIAKIKAEMETLENTLTSFDKDAAIVITKEAIAGIKSAPILTEAMAVELVGLQALLKNVEADVVVSGEVFKGTIGELKRSGEETLASIDAAREAMNQYSAAVAKIGAKQITPFDDLITKSETLQKEYSKAAEAGGDAMKKFETEAKGLLKQVNNVRAVLPEMTEGKSNSEVFKIMTIELEKSRQTILTTKGDVAKLANTQKKLNGITAENGGNMKENLRLQKAIVDRKIESLDAEERIFDLNALTAEDSARIVQIEIERGALVASRLSDEVDTLTIAMSQVKENQKLEKLQMQLNAGAKDALSDELKRADLAERLQEAQSGKKTTASEAFKRLKDEKETRQQIILMEYTAKAQTISMQYDLLNAQLALERQKAKDANQQLDAYDALRTAYADVELSALEGVGRAYKTAIEGDNVGITEGERSSLTASRTAGGTTSDRIGEATGPGGALDPDSTLATIGDKTAAAVNAMQPMMELMGPEGGLISAVANGAVAITDAWSDAFKNMGKEGVSSMAVAMDAASATLGALGSILAESSKGRIAGVDDEIAAEQKRDGQSAASVAKIKKLEAKKEAIKRKAFETDKKIRMAQTIMNTASGIMAYMEEKNIPMAVATGVMGAIQLATIASTSYKGGGGSAPQATVPTQVAVGSRSASVDLARGNNAGGEQAYMRGEAGVGSSMTDFTRAFTGAKYRASGGETAGFMVGEQGPEMFIPDRAGRIAPADETSNMNNAPTNINFSISAVDSQGVEELLINQKGNIIKMIREAANEHGEFFLEAVQEKTY